MQQQFRSLEQRAGHEAPLHRVRAEEVEQGEQGHPLVMHHIRLNGCARFVRTQTVRRVIDRFIETVGARAPLGRQELQVFTRLNGRNHQRHRRGIRSDHEIFGQSSFQAQSGHAKGAVLIVELNIGPVITRLGYAPWHAAQFSILDLLGHGGLAGVIEQRFFIAGHDQHRHQVFEHRPTPGNERRFAPRGNQRAPHREPVILRHLPEGDGDITAQPRLRGQQIVEAVVAPPVANVESDGKQVLRRVEKKREVHCGQFFALPGQGFQCEQPLTGVFARFAQAKREFGELCLFEQRTEGQLKIRDLAQSE